MCSPRSYLARPNTKVGSSVTITILDIIYHPVLKTAFRKLDFVSVFRRNLLI
jgi:hypothetical protein